MSNDDNNITPLFSVVEDQDAPDPVGKTFEFHFKDDKGTMVLATGFPAFNGMIYAVLDEQENVDSINFCALASDVLFVQESDEVFTED